MAGGGMLWDPDQQFPDEEWAEQLNTKEKNKSLNPSSAVASDRRSSSMRCTKQRTMSSSHGMQTFLKT
jgi:hypothetical protein